MCTEWKNPNETYLILSWNLASRFSSLFTRHLNLFFFANFRCLFPLPKTEPCNQLWPLWLLLTQSRILLSRLCWINAWSVWQSAWFGHDLGPLGGGQQRLILNIKCWCMSYVKSLSVPWLLIGCLSDGQCSNCIHASCSMNTGTCNVNMRDW